jgi:hypothetical protein
MAAVAFACLHDMVESFPMSRAQVMRNDELEECPMVSSDVKKDPIGARIPRS